MVDIISSYQNVLSQSMPNEIDKYLVIPEMQRLKNIGYFCGADFCPNIFNLSVYYSTFDHSLSTAKMVWNFTNNYKATIASLLHDIGSPVFRHAIDFMNGDSLNQESTEEYNSKIIVNSKELKNCLDNDEININDVIDYKKYPVADNERPKLSADRLDSVLTSSLFWLKSLSLSQIQIIYNSIFIYKNNNEEEMTFKNLTTAKIFTEESNNLCLKLSKNEDILAMNMLAKITKLTMLENKLNNEDLYKLNELDMIFLIEHSSKEELQSLWHTFKNMKKINRSLFGFKDPCFYVINDDDVKKRFIDPLVRYDCEVKRISEVCSDTKKEIKKVKKYKDTKYAYVSLNM